MTRYLCTVSKSCEKEKDRKSPEVSPAGEGLVTDVAVVWFDAPEARVHFHVRHDGVPARELLLAHRTRDAHAGGIETVFLALKICLADMIEAQKIWCQMPTHLSG